MTSSSNRRRSNSGGQRDRSKSSSVQVKCKFCGNTFMALPSQAKCAKCGRPANKPLDIAWMAASFLVPFVGFLNSLLIRPHSPFAANQGLWAAVVGSALYTALFFLLHNLLQIF